jgi:ribosome-associated toxin RatA of RatAB toxin-antitoxin module
MFGGMTLSRFLRCSPGGWLLIVAVGTPACAANPTPKTLVDNVAQADAPTGSDAAPAPAAAPAAEAPAPLADEVEPVAVPIAGSELVEAKATVIVRAPLERARATVLKFEDYPQFMPEYSDAKRLGKLPSGNEKVYMEITTLGGIAKMFANVEVLPARTEGSGESHEAKFIDGNVKQFKAVWTLTKIDEGRTALTLQVFLHPAIPLPDFLVNKANLDGAKKGAIAMKKRIEAAP